MTAREFYENMNEFNKMLNIYGIRSYMEVTPNSVLHIALYDITNDVEIYSNSHEFLGWEQEYDDYVNLIKKTLECKEVYEKYIKS